MSDGAMELVGSGHNAFSTAPVRSSMINEHLRFTRSTQAR